MKNLRCYIGGTNNLEKRYLLHVYSLERGDHLNRHLQRAFNKYGADAFHFSVVRYCPADRVKILEQKTLDARWGDGLYNICKDARAPMRGLKFSESHKKNLGDSIRKATGTPEARKQASARVKRAYRNDPTLRARVSEGNRLAHADPAVKKRHSEAVRRSHARPETKKKLSAIWKGKKFSKAHRQKLSEAAKRRWACA